MVNMVELNKLIEAVEKAEPESCIMSAYRKPSGCNTAYCIAGRYVYETAFKFVRDYVELEPTRVGEIAAVELGLTDKERDHLFLMISSAYSMRDFDILPQNDRKEIMLTVLRKFRDTGIIDWNTPMEIARRHRAIRIASALSRKLRHAVEQGWKTLRGALSR